MLTEPFTLSLSQQGFNQWPCGFRPQASASRLAAPGFEHPGTVQSAGAAFTRGNFPVATHAFSSFHPTMQMRNQLPIASSCPQSPIQSSNCSAASGQRSPTSSFNYSCPMSSTTHLVPGSSAANLQGWNTQLARFSSSSGSWATVDHPSRIDGFSKQALAATPMGRSTTRSISQPHAKLVKVESIPIVGRQTPEGVVRRVSDGLGMKFRGKTARQMVDPYNQGPLDERQLFSLFAPYREASSSSNSSCSQARRESLDCLTAQASTERFTDVVETRRFPPVLFHTVKPESSSPSSPPSLETKFPMVFPRPRPVALQPPPSPNAEHSFGPISPSSVNTTRDAEVQATPSSFDGNTTLLDAACFSTSWEDQLEQTTKINELSPEVHYQLDRIHQCVDGLREALKAESEEQTDSEVVSEAGTEPLHPGKNANNCSPEEDPPDCQELGLSAIYTSQQLLPHVEIEGIAPPELSPSEESDDEDDRPYPDPPVAEVLLRDDVDENKAPPEGMLTNYEIAQEQQMAKLLLAPVVASLERLKMCIEGNKPWFHLSYDEDDKHLCNIKHSLRGPVDAWAVNSPVSLHEESNADLGTTSAGSTVQALSAFDVGCSGLSPIEADVKQIRSSESFSPLFTPTTGVQSGTFLDFEKNVPTSDDELMLTGALARLSGQLTMLEAILAQVEERDA